MMRFSTRSRANKLSCLLSYSINNFSLSFFHSKLHLNKGTKSAIQANNFSYHIYIWSALAIIFCLTPPKLDTINSLTRLDRFHAMQYKKSFYKGKNKEFAKF